MVSLCVLFCKFVHIVSSTINKMQILLVSFANNRIPKINLLLPYNIVNLANTIKIVATLNEYIYFINGIWRGRRVSQHHYYHVCGIAVMIHFHLATISNLADLMIGNNMQLITLLYIQFK